MGDNLVREGDTNAKSVKWNAYNRAERVSELDIELPMSGGKVVDQLLDLAELGKKAQEEKAEKARELNRELREIEEEWNLE